MGVSLAVGLQQATGGDERLTILEPGEGDEVVQLSLAEGESAESGGLLVEYRETSEIPSAIIADLPCTRRRRERARRMRSSLQMTNVIYGTDETSEGKSIEAAPRGRAARADA